MTTPIGTLAPSGTVAGEVARRADRQLSLRSTLEASEATSGFVGVGATVSDRKSGRDDVAVNGGVKDTRHVRLHLVRDVGVREVSVSRRLPQKRHWTDPLDSLSASMKEGGKPRTRLSPYLLDHLTSCSSHHNLHCQFTI